MSAFAISSQMSVNSGRVMYTDLIAGVFFFALSVHYRQVLLQVERKQVLNAFLKILLDVNVPMAVLIASALLKHMCFIVLYFHGVDLFCWQSALLCFIFIKKCFIVCDNKLISYKLH